QVALADGPAVFAGPRKARAVAVGDVGVDAEAARAVARVILLSHVREVDVANLILVIERDEQAAVANRNIAWHVEKLSGVSCARWCRSGPAREPRTPTHGPPLLPKYFRTIGCAPCSEMA